MNILIRGTFTNVKVATLLNGLQTHANMIFSSVAAVSKQHVPEILGA